MMFSVLVRKNQSNRNIKRTFFIETQNVEMAKKKLDKMFPQVGIELSLWPHGKGEKVV